MQAQREKQPFFKPLSNITNNEMTKPSSSYDTAIRLKANNNQQFQINRQKENENVQKEQSVGAEKLSSLHAKLHQEADRIRNWKTQTEIEIRQKDKKIQEATQTVESLRKSIIELQLQNESLSLKLQEEMGSREDILQRINATRDMCNLLKEHSARTEERLSKCETERTELKYMEKEHLKQFEELSKQFSSLEITAAEERKHFTDLLNEERLEKEKIRNEMNENLSVTEQKLKLLECQCEEKDLEIRDVRADLRKNEEKIHKLMCTLDDYKTQLTTLQENFQQKESLLSDSDDELTQAKELCRKLEAEINCVKEQLQTIQKEKETLQLNHKETESTLNAQIDCLTTEMEACNQDLNSAKERLSSLEDQLEKALNSVEEIKSAKDIIIMEKGELECQLNSLLQEKEILQLESKDNMEKMNEMNNTIEQLTMNLTDQKELLITEQSTSDELRNKIELLNEERKKMGNDIENLVKEVTMKNDLLQKFQMDIVQQESGASCLNEEIYKLKEQLQQEREKLSDMSMEKRNVIDEMKCLQEELAEKTKEINAKQKEFEKSSKTVKNLETKLEERSHLETELRTEIEELQANLETRLTEIESLKENKEEQDKMLNGELESKAKEANALDSKVKNLKETVTSKTKQIKELEKEVRTLKSKLTSQTKETESKERTLNELQEEMSNITLEKQEFEQHAKELMSQAQDEKKSADEARKMEKEMQKKSEKDRKEKEEAIQKCEHQIAEMMATLEKYQKENQKIVCQKDKEIEEMKLKVDEIESKFKMEANDTASELNNKLQDLTEKLSSTESEKAVAEKKVSKLEKKIKKYENDISKMETKVNQLQEIVDVIKSKKIEHIGVQVELEPPSVHPSPVDNSPPAKRSSDTGFNKNRREKHEAMKPMTPNIRVAPKTPQLSYAKTPTRESTPVLFKTPTTKTPSSVLKTPQRSILKNQDRETAIKKRRVAFESNGSDSDDSSSSELMEVEIGEIDDRYKAGQKNLPLHVRPSPKVKTPDIHAYDDEEEELVNRSAMSLQRKPRGPPVSKTPKQEGKVNLSMGHSNKENIGHTLEKKPTAPRTPNIRKTPSKPPGKFFKSSPKNRQLQQPKHAKAKDETWFDIDSVFGFED